MIFKTVRITNFRSFRKTQEFIFPEASGLYFMQGINEAEPRLEGNGAGKSTLWEAITWCIFGKTSRGLAAGDISHWEAGKDTWVEIDFITNAGEDASMRRSWKPNTWGVEVGGIVADLGKGDANWFAEMLGLDYQPWLNCIMTAQNQPMFLDQKSTVQAALFSEVMGLDRWITASEKASAKASSQDAVSRGLDRDLATVEAKIVAWERDDLKTALEDWEGKRAAKLVDLEVSYEQALEHAFGKGDLKAAEEAEVAVRAKLNNALTPMAGLDEQLGFAKATASDYKMREALARKDWSHAADHAESILDDRPCPTCGLTMLKREREDALADATKKTKRLLKEADTLTQQLREAEEQVKDVAQMCDEGRRLVEDMRNRVSDAAFEVRQARNSYERDQKLLDSLEDEHRRLKEEKNPYADMDARAERELKHLRIEKYDIRHILDASEEKRNLYSMWVKSFKELRLQLIAEALTELEIEVNSGVAALGLTGWELNFQVDREGKGGGIQRGFSVLVRAPNSPALVPWAAWSGGEAQRLRLAGNMGLADLIRSRSGTKLALEVWDEPTQGLSPQGVDDLLESLAYRARTEQRQIWVVDHRSHNFGGFAGGATIIKTPSGSRIKQV